MIIVSNDSLLRTLAKPVAARLMADAKQHPVMEKVCISAGQFVHQVTSTMNIWASGKQVSIS